jgi:hypothetical protein
MRSTIILCLTIVLATNACSQTTKTNEKMNSNTYPFETSDSDGQYSIIARIESSELFNKYNPLFERNGYSGNGYCWEGHISQILEKVDKALLSHIDFDPEAGAFYAYADSESTQQKFVKILTPIFTDLKKLEEYIKSADRSRIDD